MAVDPIPTKTITYATAKKWGWTGRGAVIYHTADRGYNAGKRCYRALRLAYCVQMLDYEHIRTTDPRIYIRINNRWYEVAIDDAMLDEAKAIADRHFAKTGRRM